jgi:hypothetical protein
MDKYAIELKNLKVLEDLKVIPVSEYEDINRMSMKRIEDCSEEEVVNYIEGLLGFVIIENLTVN